MVLFWIASRTAQEAPKRPQDPRKRLPRGPKRLPRGPKRLPRGPQEPPKRPPRSFEKALGALKSHKLKMLIFPIKMKDF